MARRYWVGQYRLAGLTVDQIAEKLREPAMRSGEQVRPAYPCSDQTVRLDIKWLDEAWREEMAVDKGLHKGLQLKRIRTLMGGELWAKAARGDSRAAEVIGKLSEREAKLLGLDEETVQSIGGSLLITTIAGIDLEKV